MNAMIVPMIQNSFATRKDLDDVKSYMNDGFDKTNEHIDNLEVGFNEFRSEVKSNFDNLRNEIKEHKEELKVYFERSIGVMHDKFKDDLKINTEYLEHVIRNPTSIK